MCTFDGFHVEVQRPVLRANCRITGIGKGARLSIAEAGDIVFIPAERDFLCSSVPSISCAQREATFTKKTYLSLKEQN